jgi:hypothetical protein
MCKVGRDAENHEEEWRTNRIDNRSRFVFVAGIT